MFQLKHGAALIALCFAGVALAEDLPVFDGGDVVVTASGVPQARGVAPVSVSVITAQDIAQSSAKNVQDVLATAPGVHLVQNGGTSAIVDLGGFGMTGISNTLILVDGVKQNTNDLAAPDLNYIPLASIDRIEIVRGSGAVQYGDGATGGVVNIITKSGYKAQNNVMLTQSFGSYHYRQTDAGFNLSGDKVSMDGFAQSMDTDHYRQNAAERRDGGGLGFNWQLDGGSARLYARSSNDGQRFPGGLNVSATVNQFDSDPSGTNTPLDSGTVKNDVIGMQGNYRLGSGRIYVDFASRDKHTDSSFFDYTGNPQYDYFSQRTLNENAGSIRFVQPFGTANQFAIGYEGLSGDATLASGSTSLSSVTTVSSAKQRHQAIFTEIQYGLWQGARLTVGGRTQRIDDQVTSTSYDQQMNTELHAWQFGVRQTLNGSWSVYAQQGQSFRLPNSDEVQQSTPLQPQLSHDQEIGLEWSRGQSSASLAAFRHDLTNEIQYIPGSVIVPMWGLSGQNINLPATRHQGLIADGKVHISQDWIVRGNLTWQQATFRSGVSNGINLAGRTIPQAPSWLANLGLSWSINETTQASAEANYVGTQYLDNDQANNYGTQLGAYTVVDAKLSHRFNKRVSGALAVNNLLNRQYATYGSAAGSYYQLMPGDPRNYQASVTVTF